jgi:hypothetical protein
LSKSTFFCLSISTAWFACCIEFFNLSIRLFRLSWARDCSSISIISLDLVEEKTTSYSTWYKEKLISYAKSVLKSFSRVHFEINLDNGLSATMSPIDYSFYLFFSNNNLNFILFYWEVVEKINFENIVFDSKVNILNILKVWKKTYFHESINFFKKKVWVYFFVKDFD